MIFKQREIEDECLFFEVSRDAGWLTNIKEIAEEKGDTKLTSPILFSAGIEKMGGQLRVLGELSFEMVSLCSRCLNEAKKGVSRRIDSFFPMPEEGGNVIDISDEMREQVAMAMPERLVCAGNCKGLCPGCGANLNEQTCGCTEAEAENSKFNALKNLPVTAG